MPKRILVSVFAITLFVLPAAVAAERQKDDYWHKEFSLTGAPELRISARDASVRITSWAEKKIDVSVRTVNWTIGDTGFRIREYQSGDRIEIDAPSVAYCVGLCINFNRRAEIEVRVPREGRFDISTRDGRIEAFGLKGEVSLRSGDGRLVARDLDGNLRASTGDGRVEIDGRFDDVTAHTGDGGMDIEIRPGSKMNNSWSFRSGDGSIRLRLPKELAAELDAHTGDGRIDVDVPVTSRGRYRENTIRGSMNGGGPLLSVRSGDGSISVSY
jgi:DUF4097 and DUF4098 domain-containing protein YvlB